MMFFRNCSHFGKLHAVRNRGRIDSHLINLIKYYSSTFQFEIKFCINSENLLDPLATVIFAH